MVSGDNRQFALFHIAVLRLEVWSHKDGGNFMQLRGGKTPQAKSLKAGTFIDLFAGGGGLSLGLMLAGWHGLFAIEKDQFAFETLKHNLVLGECGHRFSWPRWLPKTRHGIQSFEERYRDNLIGLRGKVTLLAGGPPCQGYSIAGRRDPNDNRNLLFREYIKVVKLIQPALLLLENVKGINSEFDPKGRKERKRGRPVTTFSQRIASGLTKLGYSVYSDTIPAADFGVPQLRERYFIIAVHESVLPSKDFSDPFKTVWGMRTSFLLSKRLPVGRPVGVDEAISDLRSEGNSLISCIDMPRSQQATYLGPQSFYQELLHGNMNGSTPNSMRLPKHGVDATNKYRQILRCQHGVRLSEKDKQRLGIRRHRVVPLEPSTPSHTLTTVPDDIIHYCEPRILTVREYARLQSFPDWYQFKGNYTSGGDRRSKDTHK